MKKFSYKIGDVVIIGIANKQIQVQVYHEIPDYTSFTGIYIVNNIIRKEIFDDEHIIAVLNRKEAVEEKEFNLNVPYIPTMFTTGDKSEQKIIEKDQVFEIILEYKLSHNSMITSDLYANGNRLETFGEAEKTISGFLHNVRVSYPKDYDSGVFYPSSQLEAGIEYNLLFGEILE